MLLGIFFGAFSASKITGSQKIMANYPKSANK